MFQQLGILRRKCRTRAHNFRPLPGLLIVGFGLFVVSTPDALGSTQGVRKARSIPICVRFFIA
jgi:hypothetical protein